MLGTADARALLEAAPTRGHAAVAILRCGDDEALSGARTAYRYVLQRKTPGYPVPSQVGGLCLFGGNRESDDATARVTLERELNEELAWGGSDAKVDLEMFDRFVVCADAELMAPRPAYSFVVVAFHATLPPSAPALATTEGTLELCTLDSLRADRFCWGYDRIMRAYLQDVLNVTDAELRGGALDAAAQSTAAIMASAAAAAPAAAPAAPAAGKGGHPVPRVHRVSTDADLGDWAAAEDRPRPPATRGKEVAAGKEVAGQEEKGEAAAAAAGAGQDRGGAASIDPMEAFLRSHDLAMIAPNLLAADFTVLADLRSLRDSDQAALQLSDIKFRRLREAAAASLVPVAQEEQEEAKGPGAASEAADRGGGSGGGDNKDAAGGDNSAPAAVVDVAAVTQLLQSAAATAASVEELLVAARAIRAKHVAVWTKGNAVDFRALLVAKRKQVQEQRERQAGAAAAAEGFVVGDLRDKYVGVFEECAAGAVLQWGLELTLHVAEAPDAALVHEAGVPPTIKGATRIVRGDMRWTLESCEGNVDEKMLGKSAVESVVGWFYPAWGTLNIHGVSYTGVDDPDAADIMSASYRIVLSSDGKRGYGTTESYAFQSGMGGAPQRQIGPDLYWKSRLSGGAPGTRPWDHVFTRGALRMVAVEREK